MKTLQDVDEMLARFEDWMKGEDGDDVTMARKVISNAYASQGVEAVDVVAKEINRLLTDNIEIYPNSHVHGRLKNALHQSSSRHQENGEKDLIINAIAEGSENWKAEYDNCRAILNELFELKTMKESLYKGNPDGKEYAERKPKAWEAAKVFLSTYQHQ